MALALPQLLSKLPTKRDVLGRDDLLKQAINAELAEKLGNRKIIHIEDQPGLRDIVGKPNITPPLPEYLKNRPQITPPLPEQLQNRPNITPPLPEVFRDRPQITPPLPEFLRDRGFVTKEVPTKDGFTSALAERAMESKGTHITKEQALKFGVKQSEIENADLNKMFEGRKSIPKEEFAERVTEQLPEINVVEKGDLTPQEEERLTELQDLQERYGFEQGEFDRDADPEYFEQVARDKAEYEHLLEKSQRLKGTKFRSHIKEPVENYRERYITAPDELKKQEDIASGLFRELRKVDEEKINLERAGQFTPRLAELQRKSSELQEQIQQSKKDRTEAGKIPVFQSPSAHQTGDPEADTNRLVHNFLGDVTSKEGRGLQTLEGQWDWEREGKEKGFEQEDVVRISPTSMAGYRIQKSDGTIMGSMEQFGTFEEAKDYALKHGAREVERSDELGLKRGKIPSHPLAKKSGLRLWVADTLQEAAKGDYDYVTAVTGQQVADRYSVDKDFNYISWEKNKDGTYNIFASPKDENEDPQTHENITKEKLLSTRGLGKEYGQRIINGGDTGKLEEEGLKLGGEWHKKTYDRDFWKEAEKLTGAESVEIEVGPKSNLEIGEWEVAGQHGNRYYAKDTQTGLTKVAAPTLKELKERVKRWEQDQKTKQRAIILTPEIKEKIKKGLPMLSKRLSKRRVA